MKKLIKESLYENEEISPILQQIVNEVKRISLDHTEKKKRIEVVDSNDIVYAGFNAFKCYWQIMHSKKYEEFGKDPYAVIIIETGDRSGEIFPTLEKAVEYLEDELSRAERDLIN